MATLYIISPPQIELGEFLPKLETALAKHKPEFFQLRLKGQNMLEAAIAIKPICQKHGVKFIINDSPEIAKQADADGVHVGDEDSSITNAHKILGGGKIIGASCYNSLELAKAAEANGANYVSFGAFYPTTTKVAKAKAEISTLLEWKKTSTTPCSAIGGINFENKKPLEDAGANYICMVSQIWQTL